MNLSGGQASPSVAALELAGRVRVLLDSAGSRDLGPQTEQSIARLLHQAKYGWQADVVLREIVAALAASTASQSSQVGHRLCARWSLWGMWSNLLVFCIVCRQANRGSVVRCIMSQLSMPETCKLANAMHQKCHPASLKQANCNAPALFSTACLHTSQLPSGHNNLEEPLHIFGHLVESAMLAICISTIIWGWGHSGLRRLGAFALILERVPSCWEPGRCAC